MNEFPELFQSPIATGDQDTVEDPLAISDGKSVTAYTDLTGGDALADEATQLTGALPLHKVESCLTCQVFRVPLISLACSQGQRVH